MTQKLPTHDPVNPLKEFRLILGLTQQELANLAHVTRHAVLRTEQGVYALPSLTIMSSLLTTAQRLGHFPLQYSHTGTAVGDSRTMEAVYTTWVTAKRRRAGLAISGMEPPVPLVSPAISADGFLSWRVNHLRIASRMEFCRLLCVHPAVVEKFEKRRQPHLPEQLHTALQEAGLLDATYY
jgi:DNA-binding XRE family transcriptional regulator